MHYALTAIIVATALIAIAVGATTGLYHFIAQLPEAPASGLQGKLAEIGALLSSGGTVYGVPTGKYSMVSVRLDPFNLTLQLPEGPSSISANKTALAVQGMVLSAPPAANFSQGGGARIFTSGNTTYIMPLMKLVSVTTEQELGTSVHLVTLSVPVIQEGFSAAGTFNIMGRTAGTESEKFERDVGLGGTAVLYVDGEPATTFSVKAGDKVRIVVIYNKILLARIG
ncbi:MAG: hypothetical protein ACP5KV_07545 [Candidatus Methanomethylicaceae archaeon]